MGFLDRFSKDGRDAARAGKERQPRHQQVRPVARPHEGAAGAARRRLGRGALRLMRRFGMMYDKTHRGRAGEGVGLRGAGREGRGRAARRSRSTCSRPTRSPGRCACSTRSSTPKERPHRRHRRGARAPRAGLRARPDQEDPAAQPPGRAQARARAAAGRPLPRRHGRGRALRRRRGAARAGRRGVGARAAARALRLGPRRRACASASGSPTASPSSAGRSPTGAPRSRSSCPSTFQIEARGADVRIKKKPGAKE